MPIVACIKWGSAFPADYVNRLYRGVMRHAPAGTRFVCFSDDARDFDPGIEVRDIPEMKLPATGMRGGPWRKLAIWSRDIGLDGDVLFLDLDVVVTGPLAELFAYKPNHLCLIQNWTQEGDGIGNSSVMRFPAGGAPHLLEDFMRDPIALSFKLVNEQMYLTRESRLPTEFWPPTWCVSFKHELMPRFPRNLWVEASRPVGAKIVVFTGNPRPHEAVRGEWPAKWYKKHYKSLRPVRWLAEEWR